MTKATFLKVKKRLSEQVAKPGGMTAEMAGERAQRELGALAGGARVALGESIGRLETMASEATSSLDAVYLEASNTLDIAGIFDQKVLCDAAYSLCELTDRLRSSGRVDWQSIGVHANALRLIWSKDQMIGPEVKLIVDGLWKLTDRVPIS